MGVTDPSDCCLNPALQVQILKETLNWGHQQLWQTAGCNSTKLPLFRGAMKFRQHGAAEQQRTTVQRAQTSPRPVSEKYITVQKSFLHMHLLINANVVQLHLTMQFLHDPTDRLKATKKGKKWKNENWTAADNHPNTRMIIFKKSGALQQRDQLILFHFTVSHLPDRVQTVQGFRSSLQMVDRVNVSLRNTENSTESRSCSSLF